MFLETSKMFVVGFYLVRKAFKCFFDRDIWSKCGGEPKIGGCVVFEDGLRFKDANRNFENQKKRYKINNIDV